MTTALALFPSVRLWREPAMMFNRVWPVMKEMIFMPLVKELEDTDELVDLSALVADGLAAAESVIDKLDHPERWGEPASTPLVEASDPVSTARSLAKSATLPGAVGHAVLSSILKDATAVAGCVILTQCYGESGLCREVDVPHRHREEHPGAAASSRAADAAATSREPSDTAKEGSGPGSATHNFVDLTPATPVVTMWFVLDTDHINERGWAQVYRPVQVFALASPHPEFHEAGVSLLARQFAMDQLVSSVHACPWR
jgi:hypothetical protein